MSCRARQKSVPSMHPSKKALGARKSERESETARVERGKNKLQHRQSRWLSKERSCGRGKTDRCQNKGDSQSCPDLGAKEWIERGSRDKWGRTVRMELDYTRQCSIGSFTKSRAIFI